METAANLTTALNNIATSYKSLADTASQLTITNAPLLLIGSGPWATLIQGMSQTVTIGGANIAAMHETVGSFDDDADNVLASVQAFNSSTYQFFNTLIGKAGLTTSVPFVSPPIAAVLRSLEAMDDALLFTIIDKTPSESDALKKLGSDVDAVTTKALLAFEGN